jgi:hypothetical protein
MLTGLSEMQFQTALQRGADGDGSQSQEYEQESILNQILSFFVPDNLLYQVDHGKFCAIVSNSSGA